MGLGFGNWPRGLCFCVHVHIWVPTVTRKGDLRQEPWSGRAGLAAPH